MGDRHEVNTDHGTGGLAVVPSGNETDPATQRLLPVMSDIPLNGSTPDPDVDTGGKKVKKPKAVHIEIPVNNKADFENTSLRSGDDAEDGSDADASSQVEIGRGNWGGQLEFIFTCIGYAVGLGNVWRFPYLCYKNGGGAFLFPYIIMLIFVGLPLFFLELAFGQYASLGPITVWKINPLFKGLGYAMVSVSWLIAVYYNVIIAHVLLYLFASFASIPSYLPWTTCDNWWNTDKCLVQEYPSAINGSQLLGNDSAPFTENTTSYGFDVTTVASNVSVVLRNGSRTPAEEYYNYYVLEMSDGIEEFGSISWKLALCLLLAWGIVLICLIRGIQSLGKVVYFTAIFPYIMLTILLIRGVTLEGASQGIIYYLKPDFARLTDPRVWSDAATQIFYSLSACSGGLIAMASYNKFDNNCLRDSLIVSLINCGTSIYAGFVIFAILGFMAFEKGVPVSEVAADGPGLAFVVYPEAISRMPCPQLWAIFFFFMMATLGFGSQFSIVECVLSALTDEFADYLRGKWQSICFRSAVILVTFLLGLPMCAKGGIYLLTLVDYSVSGFPLLFVGLLELIALLWIYGFDKFSDDIFDMLGVRPNLYWKFCWMIIAPLIIIITIISNCVFYKPPYLDEYLYPPWAESLGWCVALFPILLIPGYFLYWYCKHGGCRLMWRLMQPDEWGPANLASKKMATEVPLTPSRLHPSEQHFTFTFEDNVIPLHSTSLQPPGDGGDGGDGASISSKRSPLMKLKSKLMLRVTAGDKKCCSTSDLHTTSGAAESDFHSQLDLPGATAKAQKKSKSWLSIPNAGSFRNLLKGDTKV